MEPNELLLDHYLNVFENNCSSGDIEADHEKADEILCDLLEDLGYQNLVNKFRALKKWYA